VEKLERIYTAHGLLETLKHKMLFMHSPNYMLCVTMLYATVSV